VDDKWPAAFAAADAVRTYVATCIGAEPAQIALAPNTHDLVVRWLSALPLLQRPKIVTTDAEFHSLRRQLARFGEAGLEIVQVPAAPACDVGWRLAQCIDARTSAVAISLVFYTTGEIAQGLRALADRCRELGAELLIDAYHALNVLPVDLFALGIEHAYVTGGGYKYMQLGEGNAFLRLPPECALRPLLTGWWAEWRQTGSTPGDGPVFYPDGPDRFAGATYDPTSHYRAAEVLDFFARESLTPEFLAEVNRHQRRLLTERFDALDLDPRRVRRDLGVGSDAATGFVSLIAPDATRISTQLRARGVGCDARGDRLRFGPAPYHCDTQLCDAIDQLGELVRAS